MIDYERLLLAILCGVAGGLAICGPAFFVLYAVVRAGGRTWKEFWDSIPDKWPWED